jgi:hypothetical protein
MVSYTLEDLKRIVNNQKKLGRFYEIEETDKFLFMLSELEKECF